MQKLLMFNQITLDGYFTGANDDLSWAHSRSSEDPEWKAFVSGNAGQGGTLLFGRKTYEMMESFWPTPQAMQQMPEVAKGMNSMRKVVFSRTLKTVSWNNTTLVKDGLADAVRKLKSEPGKGITLMGSGSIVAQLTEEGLIDEYQFVVYPIALGKGRTMFDGVRNTLTLSPTRTRQFKNGNVVLWYERAT